MSAEADQIGRVLSCAGLGFGVVAAAAPELFLKCYGLRGDDTTRVFVRLWGVAQGGVGASGLRARTAEQRRDHLVLTAGVSVGNMAAILTAGKDVGWGSRLLGLATAGGFAGAAAYALGQD